FLITFSYSFFFLLLPPPPRSTLFPYTTLFRSRHAALRHAGRDRRRALPARQPDHRPGAHGRLAGRRLRDRSARRFGSHAVAKTRSEEHTSELQSRGHLVCRLLLEKKKKKIR